MTRNNPMKYTRHAKKRAQQRRVQPLAIDLVMGYGCVTRRHGADIYSLDKDSRRQLKKEIGSLAYQQLADFFNIYIVVADTGEIITVAQRHKKLVA